MKLFVKRCCAQFLATQKSHEFLVLLNGKTDKKITNWKNTISNFKFQRFCRTKKRHFCIQRQGQKSVHIKGTLSTAAKSQN